MTTDPTDETIAADEQSAAVQADPGRGPTPAEDEAADRSSKDVDLDAVGEHEQEMTELGAHVKGEGQID